MKKITMGLFVLVLAVGMLSVSGSCAAIGSDALVSAVASSGGIHVDADGAEVTIGADGITVQAEGADVGIGQEGVTVQGEGASIQVGTTAIFVTGEDAPEIAVASGVVITSSGEGTATITVDASPTGGSTPPSSKFSPCRSIAAM